MEADIVKDRAIMHIREGFQMWGIEGTEEKINTAYSSMTEIRDYMLEVYRELIKGR